MWLRRRPSIVEDASGPDEVRADGRAVIAVPPHPTGIMCRVSLPHPGEPAGRSAGVSRRTLLRGSAVAGIGMVTVTAAAGCDRGPDPAETTAQALLPLARSALADAAAARALAPQVTDYSAALGVIAEQRAQHAQALREEITRLDQTLTGQIEPSGTATSSAAPPGTPTQAANSLEGLRSSLNSSAKAARAAAIALSGYSAGLAGAVGASTTTLVEVQLA